MYAGAECSLFQPSFLLSHGWLQLPPEQTPHKSFRGCRPRALPLAVGAVASLPAVGWSLVLDHQQLHLVQLPYRVGDGDEEIEIAGSLAGEL